ncbi:phenylalanine--tRNA ligase subunit beta [Falsiporphyromonas endometrii]|uniref:Phenylalanine--tRNA ligase beta subunit n=1 Tax=Falsiporphyromonas endometrii TaxID=1387297 RepID=A0ABV9KB21_9PORP
MNVSYNRLRRYVDIDLTPSEVAEVLTSIGLEVAKVEKVESIPGGLKGLVIGYVTSCEDHPNSDHLHITKVDLGSEEPVQIVCGAPNVAQGQYVVVATIGTILGQGSDDPFMIKKSRLRGVDSFGMICSESEIGVGSDLSGIITLPKDKVRVGMPAAEYYNVEEDYVIEVEITPNRIDGTSHYGVARDLAAYLSLHSGKEQVAKLPELPRLNFLIDAPVPVQIDCPDDCCSRFQALRIDGIKVQESPEWLQNFLRTIGMKPINNVVDITNFVLMEYGQPLHAYNADMVGHTGFRVRLAESDEPFITLDGIERKLHADDIVIADAKGKALCIAGVFGGLNSGCTDQTTSIILEAANFNATRVRKTARRLGLNTDSSFRFERGLDANMTSYAIKRAASLILEIAGGQISSSLTDIYPVPVEPWKVNLSYDKLCRLVGKRIPMDDVKKILKSLEIEVVSEEGDLMHLAVPRYRTDVTRDVDVIEDILRIYGYNNIELPNHVNMALVNRTQEDKSYHLSLVISEQLVGAGFNEILCNSLVSSAPYEKLESYKSDNLVRLLNPLSNELDVMRQTLLFGGLASIARNEHRKSKRFYYFEWGNTYKYDGTIEERDEDRGLSRYSQTNQLGIWIAGQKVSGSWAHPDEVSDIAELKAHIENILKRASVQKEDVVYGNSDMDIFSQGLDIYTKANRIKLGSFGVVDSRLAEKYEVETEVYFAELNWEEIYKLGARSKFEAQPLPKFPEVKRDLALLVDKEVSYKDIEEAAFQCEKKLLKRVELFDVYEGKNLPSGKKSYALSFYLRDDNRTMSDKQIDNIMQKLIKTMEKQFDATLR